MSDIDTAVIDSLTCLTPDGRLEKRTSQGDVERQNKKTEP